MLIKLMIETASAFVMKTLTGGRKERWKNRYEVVSKILKWHINGCPLSWGLEGKFLLPER
ncbi:MAG: hypothetical protein H6752_06795 [Candidatus Omnitrophica bacterium]|nr:hypothetical protein [Candidatus Omnitrophota bacterium]